MAPRPDTSVIVVGGGIAGIAAALRLAERGVSVRLLETRKKLGGRATSFVDVRTGAVLDNCQHVTLGCCTNYLDLLARLGVLDQIAWTDAQWWIERGGRTSVIRPGPLPAPGHFSLSMIGVRFLSWPEVSSLAKAMLSIMRVDRTQWRTRTFAEFLRSVGQTDRVIRRFWEPVIVSACNLTPSRVAASSALHVFQEGFLAHRDAASIGVSKVPLLQLYDRAEEVIRAAGGTIELGCSVARVDARSVTTGDGERLTADRVVCALPVERAIEVIDDVTATAGAGGSGGAASREPDPRMAMMQRFEHSPILGVHMLFDRPVLRTPHAVLVEASTQWLFRKDAAGHSVHAVISAADDWMPLNEEQISARVVSDVREYLPEARAAQLISVRPVKEKRATFAPTPTVEANRPPALDPRDPARGLILAGDYTAIGWPATMEGATRSGYVAAAAVLGEPVENLQVPDIKIALGARVMGLRASASSV